ncbi:MAG: TetR/AcrR family transcriptional regulator [Deltaproteobacteria bacterium]|nr:TetR/AcrR family transcriptional regulator [Deltaproteobacteria bacterium]
MSRKQDIIEAATELFSQKGFHATSTHQVAKLAEVSEGIIFYYFKTKEDILLEIFYNSFDTFLEALEVIKDEAATGVEGLHAWVDLHFQALENEAKNVLILVRDFPASLADKDSPNRAEITARVEKFNQCVVAIIKRGQADGTVGPCDPDMTALVMRSMLVGATKMGFMEEYPLQRFKKALWDFCLQALNPNPSQA